MKDFNPHAVAENASAPDTNPETVRRQVRAERKRSQSSPVANFQETLAQAFDEQTVAEIVKTLQLMQLPIPDENVDFLRAYEGALFFSNVYGMVVRIELRDEYVKLGPDRGSDPVQRVNDSPWVLQPIASRNAGKAVIEICPGTHTTDRRVNMNILLGEMDEAGMQFYDASLSNIGRLPFATHEFPDGVPVVIDRLSVKRLSDAPNQIARALHRMGVDKLPQETLYADLKNKFLQAWPQDAARPDAQQMAAFWTDMRKAKENGILVAGWNQKIKDEYKIIDARISAVAYDQKLRKHFKAAARKKPTTDASLRTSSKPAQHKR